MSTSTNGMSLCTDSPAAASSSNQYNMYRYMYNSPRRPEGVHQLLWHKVEMLLVYTWVLIQTLFLIAGLAVLHFSTFSVMMCYLINGVVKGRREFLPQK
ncbi:hypothetical protein Bpfe_029904 [Biomphalaria pfeifferi]|uniref:Uncharacterized protein n=1 Tax=Biomphalaria pfeifferi TaxID=112525 RepID=A0AAD8AQS1_BIOPF|nr:hypothetical protein Bpfe_029904 [Biomphalaria pfeifferi]